jgi:hypothetical protein
LKSYIVNWRDTIYDPVVLWQRSKQRMRQTNRMLEGN